MLAKKHILGVGVTDGTNEDVLEYVMKKVIKNGEKCAIFTPNPEIIMYANKHEDFRNKLNSADVMLCDGIGLLWASRLLKNPIKTRITGVEMVEKLCKESVRNGVTVGFLGGRDSVALRTSECLSQKYPGLKIAFVGEEWGEEGFKIQDSRFKNNDQEKTHNSEFIIHNSVDILFVAFGFPKQEEWICENLSHISVKIAMGVGGSFDYLSGKVSRAPKLIRMLGLEWLFRLIRQPWRLRRQIVLLEFVFLVLREWLRR